MRLATVTGRLVATALILAQVTCDSAVAPETGDLARVRIEPTDAEVELRTTIELEATLSDVSGNPLVGLTIYWASEEPSIADVSASGVVRGNSLGTTRISASAEGLYAISTVTVVPRSVVGVELSPAQTNLLELETTVLTAVPLGRLDEEVEGLDASWSGANADVTEVDGEGR
jgi:hypothetical protein